MSYSATPQGIHEMGFVQFEDNQVMSFLAPPSSSQAAAAQMSQPLNTTVSTSTATNTTTNASMGFTHNDLLNRPSWNNEQVMLIYICDNKGENCYLRWGFILSLSLSFFLFFFLIIFFLFIDGYLDLGVLGGGFADTVSPFVYFYMFLAKKH